MKSRSKILMLAAATMLLAGADLLTGGVGLSGIDAGIFLKLRLPRMLTAVLAGAGLSLAGLQMQSVFRNPLADPHIMGVSAGAGTGAAMATLLIGASLPAAMSGLTVAVAAFLGALLTSMLVVTVASKVQSSTTLLIFGVMLGFIFSAMTSILEYSANAESLKVFYSWSAESVRPAPVSITAGMTLRWTEVPRSLLAMCGATIPTNPSGPQNEFLRKPPRRGGGDRRSAGNRHTPYLY